MSQVKDLVLDIKDMLDLDMDPRRVAMILEVPVDFVYEAMEANFFDDDLADEEIYYGA
jgi:hypothetical protein